MASGFFITSIMKPCPAEMIVISLADEVSASRDLNRGLGGVQVEAVNHRRNSSRRHDAEGPFIDLELRLRDVRVGDLFYTYGNSHRTRCPSGSIAA